MAKKDFTKSIGSKNLKTLIPTDESKEEKIKTTTTEKTNTPATVVTTFRVNVNHLSHIKAIAFWDRKKIQDVFDEALEAYISTISKSTLTKAVSEYKKRNK